MEGGAELCVRLRVVFDGISDVKHDRLRVMR
jgi:hypothetical protein